MCAYILTPWEKQFSSSARKGLPNNIYEYVQWPWKKLLKGLNEDYENTKKKNLNEMIETIEDTKEDINKETELLKTYQAEINFTWNPPGVSLTRMKERILGLIVKVNKMNCEVKKNVKKKLITKYPGNLGNY